MDADGLVGNHGLPPPRTSHAALHPTAEATEPPEQVLSAARALGGVTMMARPVDLAGDTDPGADTHGDGPGRTAAALAVYAGAFGVSFGAVAVSAGLSVAQATVLSLVLCSGASQFAFVGVVAAGGAPIAAAFTATLLGLRNAAYGPVVRARVPVAGWRRPLVAMMTIDETAAVVVAQPGGRTADRAFRLTAAALFVAWNVGTLVGAILGDIVDPRSLGLDAAVPVVFFALLWPVLDNARMRVAAALAATVAALMVPVVPAGFPVVAAAAVGLAMGWRQRATPDAAVSARGGEATDRDLPMVADGATVAGAAPGGVAAVRAGLSAEPGAGDGPQPRPGDVS